MAVTPNLPVASPAGPSPVLIRAMPWVFVMIWSTGFVVARYGMPYSPALTFLSLRYALSIVCFIAWVMLTGAEWPTERSQWLHLGVVGMFIQAGYLGGVWSAVKGGIGAGTVALLVGLQPVLTALWIAATSSQARVLPRQWMGLALGLAGLTLVVWHKLGGGEMTAWNLTLAAAALISITVGTLYQKHFVKPCDVRTASIVQLTFALIVSLPWALLEHGHVTWHPHMIGAMAWSVLVLTLGGSSLLYLLIQRGAATSVTSLMYLVPPCTAALAWLLFDEAFTASMLAGMVLTAAGVAMVVRAPVR